MIAAGLLLWTVVATSAACVPPDMAGVLAESTIVRAGRVQGHDGAPMVGVQVTWRERQVMLVYVRGKLVLVDPAMDDRGVPLWVRHPPCVWEQQGGAQVPHQAPRAPDKEQAL